MNAPGFTLLETLVAVLLLGLLAVVVMPLTLRLGHGELLISDRLQAHQVLREFIHTARLSEADQEAIPIPTHVGWWIRCQRLTPSATPSPAAGTESVQNIAHGWRYVTLSSDPRGVDAPLAEILVLDLKPLP